MHNYESSVSPDTRKTVTLVVRPSELTTFNIIMADTASLKYCLTKATELTATKPGRCDLSNERRVTELCQGYELVSHNPDAMSHIFTSGM